MRVVKNSKNPTTRGPQKVKIQDVTPGPEQVLITLGPSFFIHSRHQTAYYRQKHDQKNPRTTCEFHPSGSILFGFSELLRELSRAKGATSAPCVPGHRPARQHPAFIQTQFGLLEGDSLIRGWLGSFKFVSALLGALLLKPTFRGPIPPVAFSPEVAHTAT